jgi:dTDP-4-amino-4,6-dideoxygalactose transaminase
MSMFSFHATKVFNTIEGGALCYAGDDWVLLLDQLKNFGIGGQDDVEYIGGNAKMNEFQAAMGICNLRHIEREIGKRKIVYERYIERLSGIPGIQLNKPQADVTPNYAYFPVVFDGYKYSRDDVFERLKENGIFARKYFYPLLNACSCYKDFPTAGAEKTPVAARIADRVLTLPLYADLALDDVERICEIIRD